MNGTGIDSGESRRKVVVAMPTTGQVHQVTMDSVRAMIAATASAEVTFWWDNDRPHDRCRNALTDRFMNAPEWTHLLFVDTDVTVQPDTIDRLLAHQVPIVCAPVPTLNRRYGPLDAPTGVSVGTNIMYFDDPSLRGGLVDPESPDTGYRRVEPDDFPRGTFTCDATGLGLCLIHRQVFEQIERPWYSFVGQFAEDQVGEDVFFFRQARAAGFEILVDPSIECDHYKHIDLTHLDLLYSDKLPISPWPRLQTQVESRNVLIAVRIPHTGWLHVRTVECLQTWQEHFGDRILIENIFADTVRGGFVELARRVETLDERFSHILILGDDVVPHPVTLGLLASVDAPIVAGLTRKLIDGLICWAFWQRDPTTGKLVAPQNIQLPNRDQPFEVAAIDPACMLIRRDTLRHVESTLQLLDHGPNCDRDFVQRWCQAVTSATGCAPIQTPLTVERRAEVGLAGFLSLKMNLKARLRKQEESRHTGVVTV